MSLTLITHDVYFMQVSYHLKNYGFTFIPQIYCKHKKYAIILFIKK